MIAADVMTRQVLSVSPDATVEDAAQQMLTRGISGLFVVNETGDLVGIVTEGDLLRRDEIGTERHRPWWLRMFVSPGRQAADFTRTHGRRVSDVMTENVISVAHDSALEAVVALMEEHRIKRIAVTQNGRVAGVISRSDLLRALVGRSRTATPVAADDRTIREAILDGLENASWAPMTTVNAVVTDGVVDLWGTITDEKERRAINILAENVPGVKTVHDHMVFVEPYSGAIIEAPDDRT